MHIKQIIASFTSLHGFQTPFFSKNANPVEGYAAFFIFLIKLVKCMYNYWLMARALVGARQASRDLL